MTFPVNSNTCSSTSFLHSRVQWPNQNITWNWMWPKKISLRNYMFGTYICYKNNTTVDHCIPDLHFEDKYNLLPYYCYLNGSCWKHRFCSESKGKVKVTLVQALRLCTGHTAHRGTRGIALPFHDHGTRRGWGVSITPRPLFTSGKDQVPIVQEAGWAPGSVWTGAENLAPTGIWSPDRPACSQSLYQLRYLVHNSAVTCASLDTFWQNETRHLLTRQRIQEALPTLSFYAPKLSLWHGTLEQR